MHYYRFLGAFASTLTFLIAPNFISYRGVRRDHLPLWSASEIVVRWIVMLGTIIRFQVKAWHTQ